LTHRYPDRCLVLTTPVCSMYCRFCTRKRVTMDRDGWDAPSRDEQRMIEYIRGTASIRDVILSGGDPLTLPPAKLRWFLQQLAVIDHVEVIRIGTRVPVTLPQRLFDLELIGLLHQAEKVWIQTHFNHPREITPEAARACRNLIQAGMPINNHSVLMKGVNDSVEVMRQLVCGLMRIKVRPYYLFHCDPVTGAGHFRTSVWKGIEIIEGLRGHVSGLAVPTYVVDGLHGAGKIPLMPNYLISASNEAVVLRNYEGLIFRYAPEDRPLAPSQPQSARRAASPPATSIGVSHLLSEGGGPLVPQDNPRLARRKRRAADAEAPAAKAPVGPGQEVDSSHGHVNGSSAAGRKPAARRPASVKPTAKPLAKNGTKAAAGRDPPPPPQGAGGLKLPRHATARPAPSAKPRGVRVNRVGGVIAQLAVSEALAAPGDPLPD
jgi:lysine 2,3-aminomutase